MSDLTANGENSFVAAPSHLNPNKGLLRQSMELVWPFVPLKRNDTLHQTVSDTIVVLTAEVAGGVPRTNAGPACCRSSIGGRGAELG